MCKKILIDSCALMLGTLFFNSILAAELAPLSSSELHEHCLRHAKGADSAAGVCAMYVRAFIEGSHQLLGRGKVRAQ